MNPHVELAKRFAGRTDVYGYGGERCYCVKSPLTGDVWHGHITNGDPIGVYPLRADGMVHFGCSDFDTVTAEDEARLVQKALKVMAIPSWPEISRSGGYHLWVFLPDKVWVPALEMRSMLLLAHTLAEVPAKEVNPKTTTQGALGNFVRIPYPGATLGQGRQVMLDPYGWKPLTLRQFLDDGPGGTARAKQVEVHSAIWLSTRTGPETGTVQPTVPYDGSLDVLVKRFTSGVAVLLFKDGPINGDRSEGLWRLSNDCRRADLSTGEALAILQDADQRWGKHNGDEDKLWRYYVSRAYGQWVE